MYRILTYAFAGALVLAHCGSPERPTHEADTTCEVDPAVGICHDPTPHPIHPVPSHTVIVCDPPGGGLFSICDATIVDGP